MQSTDIEPVDPLQGRNRAYRGVLIVQFSAASARRLAPLPGGSPVNPSQHGITLSLVSQLRTSTHSHDFRGLT